MSEPNKREVEKFRSLLSRFGLKLSWDQTRKLGIFLDELEEWSKKFNLTGLSSRQSIINELLIDSMMPAPFIPDKGNLLDIGSGAGFPAIPIKISKPGLHCQLMEPNSKKISFLKQVIRLADLEKVAVIKGRIGEEEGLLHPEGYNVITSRGLAPLPQFLTWGAPHLTPGGLIVAFLGSQIEEAMKKSADVIRKHNLFLFKSIAYSLSGKSSERNLLILKRRGNNT
ncbi:MAG: 16S rRNA (guanine(527)-N(7))-methyltransferase RsmG [Deltaproteobacteria bacterium]|nr:16S rRNA (guanine(527)-N(7))-methyltransferase RsmG [Deltaproteobacteria bacterium]MBW2202959.1 16S rRNA (guanine(527)-N(7))-methyltransferase RsmG [Deltaproteobacteria bacterium]